MCDLVALYSANEYQFAVGNSERVETTGISCSDVVRLIEAKTREHLFDEVLRICAEHQLPCVAMNGLVCYVNPIGRIDPEDDSITKPSYTVDQFGLADPSTYIIPTRDGYEYGTHSPCGRIRNPMGVIPKKIFQAIFAAAVGGRVLTWTPNCFMFALTPNTKAHCTPRTRAIPNS